MENTKKHLIDILKEIHSGDKIDPSIVEFDNQLESLLEDVREVYSDYRVEDSLIGVDARKFRETIFNYNIAGIYDFSNRGAKPELLMELEDLIVSEIQFLNKKHMELDSNFEVIKLDDLTSYKEYSSSIRDYIDRCEDVSILTNKILNLLEAGYTQKELDLSTSNPRMSEFFLSLKKSDRLNKEFSLYINSIKNKKNELLDELL